MLADGTIEVRKLCISVDDAEDIAHGHVPIAIGKSGAGDAGGFIGNRFDPTGVE